MDGWMDGWMDRRRFELLFLRFFGFASLFHRALFISFLLLGFASQCDAERASLSLRLRLFQRPAPVVSPVRRKKRRLCSRIERGLGTEKADLSNGRLFRRPANQTPESFSAGKSMKPSGAQSLSLSLTHSLHNDLASRLTNTTTVWNEAAAAAAAAAVAILSNNNRPPQRRRRRREKRKVCLSFLCPNLAEIPDRKSGAKNTPRARRRRRGRGFARARARPRPGSPQTADVARSFFLPFFLAFLSFSLFLSLFLSLSLSLSLSLTLSLCVFRFTPANEGRRR